jgi:hypothetical protein
MKKIGYQNEKYVVVKIKAYKKYSDKKIDIDY